MLYALLPIIAHTVFTIFYAPDLRDILSSTASNTAASGGFGANQVSTVFGLGMFIVAVRFFSNSKSLELKLFNLVVLGVITYRALVTLSRGGIFAAFIALAAFLVIYYPSVARQKRNQLVLLFGLFSFGLFVSWSYSSFQSNGMLDKRYANEDSLGREKNDISTGRFDLFEEEISGFLENPFFGIGSSRAKDQRIEDEWQGQISHNEVSRTLASMVFLVLLYY